METNEGGAWDSAVMTVEEAAVVLGVSERAIQSLAQRGRLVGKRAGRDWILSRESVEARLAEVGHGGAWPPRARR